MPANKVDYTKDIARLEKLSRKRPLTEKEVNKLAWFIEREHFNKQEAERRKNRTPEQIEAERQYHRDYRQTEKGKKVRADARVRFYAKRRAKAQKLKEEKAKLAEKAKQRPNTIRPTKVTMPEVAVRLGA